MAQGSAKAVGEIVWLDGHRARKRQPDLSDTGRQREVRRALTAEASSISGPIAALAITVDHSGGYRRIYSMITPEDVPGIIVELRSIIGEMEQWAACSECENHTTSRGYSFCDACQPTA